MYDSHVHSNFSGDSTMSISSAYEKAIDLGLSGITFTDHLDIDYPNYEDDYFSVRFDEYLNTIAQYKKNVRADIDVFSGIEIGYQPHTVSLTFDCIRSYPFDFIINSVHLAQRLDPYEGNYFEGKSQNESYEVFLLEIIKSANECLDYDVIGHIDYIRRYGDFQNKIINYRDFSSIFDELFQMIIKKGKGLELNTAGVRYKLQSPLPDINIYKKYKESGGEIITIGSDAHTVDTLGLGLDLGRDFLIEAGFEYYTVFENRKPCFYKL
jgi:histidinol-phosphatase (PHP family)